MLDVCLVHLLLRIHIKVKAIARQSLYSRIAIIKQRDIETEISAYVGAATVYIHIHFVNIYYGERRDLEISRLLSPDFHHLIP